MADHAEKEKVDEGVVPSSSSGSGGSSDDHLELEKQRMSQDTAEEERKDTVGTLPEKDTKRQGRAKRTHTITLGPMIRLRADNDDEPSDWWFASTAIPLIAATFAPMANVLSIAALVVYWRNKIPAEYAHDPYNYQAMSVGLQDPKW